MNNDYKINYAVYAVRENGEINVEATVAKFERELATYAELQNKDQDKILGAIENVFSNASANATLNKPSVVTLVLAAIGFQSDTFNTLKERVETVLDENDRYYTVKGKGGGLRRMSDTELDTFHATGKTPDVLAREAKEAEKKASATK